MLITSGPDALRWPFRSERSSTTINIRLDPPQASALAALPRYDDDRPPPSPTCPSHALATTWPHYQPDRPLISSQSTYHLPRDSLSLDPGHPNAPLHAMSCHGLVSMLYILCAMLCVPCYVPCSMPCNMPSVTAVRPVMLRIKALCSAQPF